jgi:mannose-1-phosphate guanylyltransferase/mannose-6-phosphate isomerase
MFYPVVLIGGSGTRLWPMSRTTQPKQLLPVTSDEHSMLQETLLRLREVDRAGPPLVICNHQHRFQVAEQIQEINVGPLAVMLEPMARNTAAAIAVCALRLLEEDHNAMMLALPSDHVITNVPAFAAAVARAREAALQNRIVLFGIVPDKPETGFGYIQRAQPDEQSSGEPADGSCYEIARFVEKPDAVRAQEYVNSGDYLWNSGMFMARADVVVREMEQHVPNILAACRSAMDGAYRDLDFLRLGRAAFEACPAASIDVAVLEKTSSALVIPVSMGWNDVGSWTAMWDVHDKNAQGNVVQGDVILHDTHNCFVSAQKHLVATVGLRDLIIVESDDAILVTHKDSAQAVKKIVEELQRQGRTESEIHRRVYRPWGSYEGIVREERFQVKRIIVKPGAQLSLQKHFHRAEHWIVVSGTAEVVRGDEVHLITENQAIYIPLGTLHRLRNPGHIPLHLIEVQSGSYLGEDDIVRVHDEYGRLDEQKLAEGAPITDVILDATNNSNNPSENHDGSHSANHHRGAQG